MENLNILKNYINEQYEAASELGFKIEVQNNDGQGVLWLYKEA